MSSPVEVFPCSSSQARLWLLEQLGRGHGALTVRAPLRLPGQVVPDQVRKALANLVARHEALRTTFAEVDGHPVQRIHPPCPVDLPCTDLRSLPMAERGRRLRQFSVEIASEPFELAGGPLLRAHLVLTGEESVLLLAFHHIIVDGWSVNILHDELRVLLAPAVVHPPELPPLRLQYADFALWQRRTLAAGASTGARAWWESMHAGAPDRPPLLGGHWPVAPVSTGTRLSRDFSPGEVQRLRGLVAATEATPFAVLLTAYAIALSRRFGQQDLVIGTLVAGRTHADLAGVIGFFVNTLPLRVQVQPGPLAPQIRPVRDIAREALDRQDVPFEEIARRVGRSDRPLFEAMFNFLEGQAVPRESTSRERRHDRAPEVRVTSQAGAHSALELYALDRGEAMSLELVYASERLDAALATELLEDVLGVLTEATPDQPPAAAPPRWSDPGLVSTPGPAPAAAETIGAVFDDVARRHADRIALQGASGCWTYTELAAKSRAIARAVLRTLIPDVPKRVGVVAAHDNWVPAAVLGVLSVGAAYVPLDPGFPAARLAEIATDAELDLVLCDTASAAVRAALAELRPDLRWMEVDRLPAIQQDEVATDAAEPNDLAYLLYTSGTTGRPKAVVQSHRNVVGHIRTYAQALQLTPADGLSLMAGVGTDAAVMDLFGALLSGAGLHLIDPRSVALDELPAAVERSGVTVLHLTPTLLRALVPHLTSRFTRVRLLVLGGEAATRADLACFCDHFPPDAALVNGYGPTECTVAMQFFADQDTVVSTDALPLGAPVPGVQVRVEDEAGSEVAPGGVGQIVLRSARVALGYWRRPGETSRAFLDTAGNSAEEPRTYRTGDLARVHPDGTLTFAGRADDQIKVRGYRVEPGDIEAALRRQQGIQAAAVFVGSSLTAYLVLAPDAAPAPAGLRRALRRTLPEAMIPVRYQVVDHLRLTPSGKIDRRAVAADPGARPLQGRAGTDRAVLGDEQQTLIAEVWAEVLNRDASEIGPTDTFFDFGGHSLLLTQVAARLTDRIRVRLPLRVLFENPSLADLAAALRDAIDGEASSEEATTPPPAVIPRRTTPGPYPLSSAQARLWFLDELAPGQAIYTMSLTLVLDSGVRRDEVQAVLDALIIRHEALRTTFEVIGGEPFQRVDACPPVRVALTDLTGLDHRAAVARNAHIAEELAGVAFNLRAGPPMRAHLVDLGEAGTRLHLAVHHIVADGWSLGLLREQFMLGLAAHREGRDCPLAEPALQYPDYAVWERTHATTLEAGLRWWMDALDGAPARIDLPTERRRPAVPSFAGALAVQPLDSQLIVALRQVARTRLATPFMVYLAAFATVLNRWSGQDDLVIGTPVAGRTSLETEDVVGLFVNSLPLRIAVAGAEPFTALLDTVRDVVTAAQEHQDVPFDAVVRVMAPQRRLAHAPLFQVMFAVGSAQVEDGAPADAVTHSATAKFDLSVTLDDGVVPAIYVEYATDLFSAAGIEHFLTALLQVLREAADDPHRPVDRLVLAPDVAAAVGPALRRPTSGTWPLPPGGSGLAVVGSEGSISHDELRATAVDLKERLRRLELPGGAVIAIDLPRGPALVAALHAVPLAGCAFLLLDPALPDARRADLLSAAGARVLLRPDTGYGIRLEEVPGRSHEPDTAAESSDFDDLDDDLPAYLVATSGSTGAPKVVVIPRIACRTQVAALTEAYGLTRADRVLQFSALGFDVALEEIWPTIAAGGTVDFGVAGGPPSFAELESLCRPGGISVVNLPASYWHEWVGYLSGRPAGSAALAGLRLAIVGSEPVRPDVVARWQALSGDCELVCAYGTSETTITNSLFVPERDREWAAVERVPIGTPLAGSRILVVDAVGRLVPPGVVGEIAVEGDCLALGYLGQPGLTAQRFVAVPQGRRYLTGDRGRQRFDGAFEVLGRLDDQFTLGGHRIEPGEIEIALARQPGVAACAVALRPGARGQPRLLAYVVPAGTQPLSSAQLRAGLQRVLVSYLVPAEYAVVDALPRTPSGKIDRAALSTLVTTLEPAPPPGPAPTGAAESTVAQVWAETLQIPLAAISATSNFFDLGGDSILSLQIAWRLGAKGMQVGLADLFTHQTVAELAAAISPARDPAAQPSDAAAEGQLPLTPIQCWFLEANSPEPHHDNLGVLLRLVGDMADDRLEAALGSVVASHDALRTRFQRTDQGWQAETRPRNAGVPVQVHGPDAVVEQVAATSHAALDLAQGPLLRADLLPAFGPDGLRDRSRPSQLLLVAHHLVVDVLSWQVIIEDLTAALQRPADAGAEEHSQRVASWGSWARSLARWAQSEQAGKDARWWLDRIGGSNCPVRLPVPPTGPAGGRNADEQVVRVTLGADETGQLLRRIPIALGARMDEAILAALAMAVSAEFAEGSSHTRMEQRDAGRLVLIDVEGHGREPLFPDLDVSRTVGWFTTLRPTPLRVQPGDDVVANLTAARDVLRSMPRLGIAHGAVLHLRPASDPLAQALRELPSAQISLNYLGRLGGHRATGAVLAPGGPVPGPARSPRASRPYPIDVVAAVISDELVIWLSYADSVLSRQTVESLAHRGLDNLHRVLAACQDTQRPGTPTVVDSYPLTPLQEAMVFGMKATRGGGVYVAHTVLRLPADTDQRALREAWEVLLTRHEVLRTRFVEDADGSRRQEVLTGVTLPWRVVDWRHLAPGPARERLQGLLDEDFRRGYEIDRAPLMRVILAQLPAGPQLIWSHHHALLDGWSAAGLLDELTALLEGGRRAAARRPPPPFRTYLEWLGQRDLAADEAYWTSVLAVRPELAGLPRQDTLRDAPAVDALGVTLPPELREALARRAREWRVSTAALAHAAWALVLKEYTRSTDVVFGATAAGRPVNLAGADAMVGLLITTHPARVKLPADAPVADWVRNLAAREMTHREHAHAGLTRISRWAQATPETPLFDSLLVVENYRRPTGRAGPTAGVPGEIHPVSVREVADVPLSVVVGRDLDLQIVFDAQRFDPDWIRAVLRSLLLALEGLTTTAERTPLGELDILGPALRRRLLQEWNDTARPLPQLPLGAQWQAAAARHVAAVAVTDPIAGDVSYGELAAAADRVAHSLRARGARPGDFVGVVADRSAEMLAAVLGVVQAGCGYVPLDPAYPDERLNLMVAATGMRLALAHHAHLLRLPQELRQSGAAAIDGVLEESWGPGVPAPTIDRQPAPEPLDIDAPAYVIFTSGSTGTPKGVVVPHRAVTRLVVNADYCRLGPGSGVAFCSTLAFDASTFEIWAPLLSGARIVPLDRDTILSPPRLAAALRHTGITTVFLTTAVFNAVAADQPDAFAPLRDVLFGGERADPNIVRRVLEAGPPARLVNVYGPTETTTFASYHQVLKVPAGTVTIPIGRPIANTELLVLDQALTLVPPGVAGELCIGGPGLALGYLGDAELTRQRFVPHPYRPGSLLYRSGDLAVQRPDGVIEIRGRADDQVKIRGFRIEPGEVEAHLLALPGVGAGCVVALREATDIHFLAAYAVPAGTAELDPQALRGILREQLPEHLVPSTITVLEALPLTSNGKVDVSRLPNPREGGTPASCTEPEIPTERAIAAIWARVLRIEETLVTSGRNFFELGGHSLLLAQVAAQLRRDLEVDLPLRVLFETRTLRELAALVEASERTPSDQIPVVDRSLYRASLDADGRLRVSAALRERLRSEN